MDLSKIANKIAGGPYTSELHNGGTIAANKIAAEPVTDLEIELNNLWWAQKSCQEIFEKHNNESNPSEHEIDMKDFWKEWNARVMKCVNRINEENPNK